MPLRSSPLHEAAERFFLSTIQLKKIPHKRGALVFIKSEGYPITSFTFLPISAGESTT